MLGKVTLNNILIRLHVEPEIERKSAGGIILPSGLDDEAKKKLHYFNEHPLQGDVIQVGDLVTKIKPGDRVYLNSNGIDLVENSIYYSVVREHDIIYVIDKEIYEEYKLKKQTNEIAN